MKVRSGFVSNSSSSSFIITNKTSEDKTLVDFVMENPQLVEEFVTKYYWHEYTQEELLESAERRRTVLPANSSHRYIFGDEDGDVIGHVFDYILRDDGSSDSFAWEFDESLR